MKKILKNLFEYKTLDRAAAKEIMLNIGKGVYNDTELTAFMTVFLLRSITIEELEGFRDGLLELAVQVRLQEDVLDIVGTGGDGKNTYNISTLACFVVAGTNVKVAKHGNYAATSVSGASNVLELLGYRFSADTKKLERELEVANFTFLHAPLFHPALKNVASIRKQIGFRTFFNMLGPIVNPVQPKYKAIGVYNLELARIYTYLLQQLGEPFTIIHGLDGYDEISLTGDTKLITQDGEKIYTARELGKRTVTPVDIFGGSSVEEAAAIFTKVLRGEGSWAQNAVVLANAAVALQSTRKHASYNHCYQACVDSLESGMANQKFQQLISIQ